MCPRIRSRLFVEYVAKTRIYHKRSLVLSINPLNTWDVVSMTAFPEGPEELSPDAEGERGSSRAGDECYDSLVSGLCSACDLVAPSVDELCRSV
jgi:hypothetical protein